MEFLAKVEENGTSYKLKVVNWPVHWPAQWPVHWAAQWAVQWAVQWAAVQLGEMLAGS